MSERHKSKLYNQFLSSHFVLDSDSMVVESDAVDQRSTGNQKKKEETTILWSQFLPFWPHRSVKDYKNEAVVWRDESWICIVEVIAKSTQIKKKNKEGKPSR